MIEYVYIYINEIHNFYKSYVKIIYLDDALLLLYAGVGIWEKVFGSWGWILHGLVLSLQ